MKTYRKACKHKLIVLLLIKSILTNYNNVVNSARLGKIKEGKLWLLKKKERPQNLLNVMIIT
jgi:hypothetical protein